MARTLEQPPQEIGGESSEHPSPRILEPDLSGQIRARAREVLDRTVIKQPAAEEAPIGTQIHPLTVEERIKERVDAQVKEDIVAALGPHIHDVLMNLLQQNKLRTDSILTIPKDGQHEVLIDELRRNNYLASEEENSVQLDLEGRIIAGLFYKSGLSDLAKRYLREPYSGITRKVITEKIKILSKNIKMK